MATPKQSSSINDLVNQVTVSGLAFSNRYEVFINTPSVLNQSEGSINTDLMRSISLRCESITIPGRSFSTIPFRFYGPARNMPYEQIYSGEVVMTFMLSEDLRERDFFEKWMQGVSRPNDYKFEYYANYTTNMEIDVITRDQQAMYKVNLEEVYPKIIGDIQVGYDKYDEYMRQDITMCFRKYTTTYIGRQPKPAPVVPPPPTDEPKPQTLLQKIVQKAKPIVQKEAYQYIGGSRIKVASTAMKG